MDERLTLAASLYTRGEWGADIGTDHGFLPCAILEQGICDRMIAADIGEKPLAKARAEAARRGLSDRMVFTVADGLAALDHPVTTVSIMGMGGRNIAEILHKGADRLQGAHLVLSAHTDQALVRSAVTDLGYHFTAERLCFTGGRFYLMWKAEPGAQELPPEAVLGGTDLLFSEPDDLLQPWLRRRLSVLAEHAAGLRRAQTADTEELNAVARET